MSTPALVRVTIDGRPVEVVPGSTLLAAARKLGLDVPALCYLPGCEPNTACMACVMRRCDDGRIVPSCATPAEEGLAVESESDEIRALRRIALELMLSDHPFTVSERGAPVSEAAADPPVDGRDARTTQHSWPDSCDCDSAAICRLRKYALAYGADPRRFAGAQRAVDPEHVRRIGTHPEIAFDPSRCILCGLCVQIARAAGEPVGLALTGRGFDTRVDVPLGGELSDALTASARRCAGACPTVALRRRTSQ